MIVAAVLMICGALAVGLWYAIRRKWVRWGGRSIATLTAFHDFQTEEKQEAIEYVLEKQAQVPVKARPNDQNDP